MNFRTEKHLRTDLSLVAVDDEIFSILEEQQTQLQTLLSSKFISHFVEQVLTWRSQMSTADMVSQLLIDVQRTWSNLETIFIATDDIRIQLPQESIAFDRIDAEFRVNKKMFSESNQKVFSRFFQKISDENQNDLNFLRLTNRLGLHERLEKLKNELQVCQKALENYLGCVSFGNKKNRFVFLP